MFAIVGGYTTSDRDGRGDGVRVYQVDGPQSPWRQIQHIGELENPSLFTLSKDKRRLYAVHGARTLMSAFALDPATGALRLINRVPSGGINPVEAALDPTERHLVIANYTAGNVAVMDLARDGALRGVGQVFQLPGKRGTHPTQQPHAHPHGVIFDPSGRFAIVPDKGFDCVFVFQFRDGRISLNQIATAKVGSAPRHCVFHPRLPVLYVNNELDSTVTAWKWDPALGTLSDPRIASTIPMMFTSKNTTAEIAASPNGRFVYVSNRGHDSVAIFAADQTSGALSMLGCINTGGKTPRFFTLDRDGTVLYAANQDSDTITRFRLNERNGLPERLPGDVAVGSPSAITLVA